MPFVFQIMSAKSIGLYFSPRKRKLDVLMSTNTRNSAPREADSVRWVPPTNLQSSNWFILSTDLSINNCRVRRIMCWLIYRLIDWLIDWYLIDCSVNWLIDRFVFGWLIDWLSQWMIDWLIGWLVGWFLFDRLSDGFLSYSLLEATYFYSRWPMTDTVCRTSFAERTWSSAMSPRNCRLPWR